ncbi:MAG: MlaD family protein [Verrucomicrobiota bacterium]|nr:MCE family protein [Chthoniobacterales bacterium]MDQ3415185.1 MlaD family protein [Verrucomicrobiota bacterium]
MSEHSSTTEPPLKPVVKKGRRFSPIWIIPLVAAALGLWLAWQYYAARGPEITVRFETAEGIVGGKTPVLCKNVNIGTVNKVRLTKDLKGVIVTMQMTSEATDLLTKDTQIWVVRPRYGGASGVSGLSTIVSGSYIELEPGLSDEPRREFVGLENPPVTPKGVPGLHITLFTDEAGSIGPGAPILYKGLSAGKIETRIFHPEKGNVEFSAFISKEFSALVRKNTKFWNASGVDLSLGADGLRLHTGSLETLLLGGITFDQPEGTGTSDAPAVADGATFLLYGSLADTKKFEMQNSLPYLLLFSDSVRGLSDDAPVDFRGVRIGTVKGVSFKYLPNDPERRVPVLVQIDPGLITDLPTESTEPAEEFVAKAVANGLRASLKTGNYLTGQMYVDLDFDKSAPPASVTEIAGYRILPTGGSSLSGMLDKASALLDKLQALPLESTIKEATETLATIKTTVAGLDKTVNGYGENGPLYQKLNETLQQLDDTLRSIRALSNTIERKPNSLIFGKPGKVAPPKGSSPP